MPYTIPDAQMETIIYGDPVASADKIVEVAKPIGEHLKSQRLSTTQIRGIFGTVRRIERSFPHSPDKAARDFRLLEPRLAYQGARHDAVKDLGDVLTQAIRMAKEPGRRNIHNLSPEERFQRFADFFEAVLAYHIAAGGS